MFLQFLWTVQALETHNFSESEIEKVMKRRIGSKLFITFPGLFLTLRGILRFIFTEYKIKEWLAWGALVSCQKQRSE